MFHGKSYLDVNSASFSDAMGLTFFHFRSAVSVFSSYWLALVGEKGWRSGGEHKSPICVTRVQIPVSTQYERVSIGLAVSRHKRVFFYRQPSKMQSNINRQNVSRYCKSHYFSWSSRTFGSRRISSLEKRRAMLSKTLSLDITRPYNSAIQKLIYLL